MGAELIRGKTTHARVGAERNAFTYSVDYVLIEPEAPPRQPLLMRLKLWSVRTRDHGGTPGYGEGAAWVRRQLAARGLTDQTSGKLHLLTQPRVFGHVFNPVSFWLCHDAQGALTVVIAEVTNTYGDRHAYLCANPDLVPITPETLIETDKAMHVSPFQDVAGSYTFRFGITPEAIDIRIAHQSGNQGLIATLAGPRVPLTNRAILWSVLRRPLGARRVLTLIHWQALKLWWKGATFRRRPRYSGKGLS